MTTVTMLRAIRGTGRQCTGVGYKRLVRPQDYVTILP